MAIYAEKTPSPTLPQQWGREVKIPLFNIKKAGLFVPSPLLGRARVGSFSNIILTKSSKTTSFLLNQKMLYSLVSYYNLCVANHFIVQKIPFLYLVNHFTFFIVSGCKLGDTLMQFYIKRLVFCFHWF